MKHRWRHLVISVGAFLATVVANYLLAPESFVRFLNVAASHDERGKNANLSLLAFLKDLAAYAKEIGLPEHFVDVGPLVVFAGIVGVIVVVTGRSVRFSELGVTSQSRVAAIFMTTLVYALVLPRLKTYSFVVLLPATLYVIRNCRRWSAFILLLIVTATAADPSYPTQWFTARFSWYFPTLVVGGIWVVWVRETSSKNGFSDLSQNRTGIGYKNNDKNIDKFLPDCLT
jgi:hypothetical protein